VNTAALLQPYMQWTPAQAGGLGTIATATFQKDFKLQTVTQGATDMDIEYFEALVASGYTPETARKIAEGMDKFINNISQKEGK